MNAKPHAPLGAGSARDAQSLRIEGSIKEIVMFTKSRLLKTSLLAAFVSLAGAAAITPASAHDMDRGASFARPDGDRFGDSWRRHERFEFWRHHRHFHPGWYR